METVRTILNMRQVHAAKLKDGSEVVVKVQYPMVEKLFQSDFETCRAFCKLAQPEQLAAFNELEKQFRLEFDFKREAWALESVHKNITPHFPNVLIPKPVLPLCSRLVLVMSQVPGDKLVDAVLRHYEEFSACIGVKMGELKELSKFQLYRRLAKMYLNGYFTWYLAWAWNHTLGYATKKWDYPKVLEALDGKKLLETIIRIHGHELLINGLFNGDPHPGNILLSYKHHQPVIGLIDYGQVKELTRQQRIHLAQLIVALAQNDQTKVFKIMVALGFRSEKMDTNVFFKQATIALNRNDKEFTEGYNLQQYVEIFLNMRLDLVMSWCNKFKVHVLQ
ncbi:hypothetical protein HMI55_000031 [Coelomomyces lativittatus]|nr:hypothetical protein HMI55_000031 [Coelomomyces lativittatus]